MEKDAEWVGAIERTVNKIMGIKSGEGVVLVRDSSSSAELVDQFAKQCIARGAEVCVTNMLPRSFPGELPPRPVVEAMKNADVVLELTTMWCGALLRPEFKEKGVRYALLLSPTPWTLRPGGPFFADFEALDPWLKAIGARIDQAKTIRVTSPLGTDLWADISTRKARPLNCIGDYPGAFLGPPDTEVSVAPIETSTEGVIVVDTCVELIGAVDKPFRIRVEKGKVVGFEDTGGQFAVRELERLLKAANDPNVYAIAEISSGINPLAQYHPTAFEVELEGIIGSIHFGIGDSIPYGGVNKANGHFDVLSRQDVTIFLDDEPLVQGGEILVPGRPW